MTIIEVKVKTSRPLFGVRTENGHIVVDLAEVPEGNKANVELVRMFTKLLKRPVFLVSGHTSRAKKLRIENMEKDGVLSRLRT